MLEVESGKSDDVVVVGETSSRNGSSGTGALRAARQRAARRAPRAARSAQESYETLEISSEDEDGGEEQALARRGDSSAGRLIDILRTLDEICHSDTEQRRAKKPSGGKKRKPGSCFPKGVGYGGGYGSVPQAMRASMEKKKTEEHALDTKASELLDSLSKVVTGSDSLPYDAASRLAASKGLAWALLRILGHSPSLLDLGRRSDTCKRTLAFVSALASERKLESFLVGPLAGTEGQGTSAEPSSVASMLSELAEQAKVFVALTNGKRGNSGVQGDEEEELEVEALALCLFITDANDSVGRCTQQKRRRENNVVHGKRTCLGVGDNNKRDGPGAGHGERHDVDSYVRTMRALRFAAVPLRDMVEQGEECFSLKEGGHRNGGFPPQHAMDAAAHKHAMASVKHAMASVANALDFGPGLLGYGRPLAAPAQVTSRGRSARVMSEVTSLASSLPVEWASSILVRVDETRPDHIKALIVGPEDSPYENGLFEFDILLGASYPSAPPTVNFVTTGGGKVRFNPNLYNCGKVCLSLLGTWSGPGWDPATSTLLQVLVSIQALIFVKDPFYNEPGYERLSREPAGKAQAEKYDQEIRTQTLRVAMLGQMSKARKGVFAEAIAAHFSGKRGAILRQLTAWESCTPGTKDLCAQVRSALQGVQYVPEEPESDSGKPAMSAEPASSSDRGSGPVVDLT